MARSHSLLNKTELFSFVLGALLCAYHFQPAVGQAGFCQNSTVPSYCSCWDNTTLHCSGGSFDTIPADLASNLTVLKIENSQTELKVLSSIPYPNLEKLHLDNLGIRYISDFAFAKLTKLQKLTLIGNRISGLSNNTFSGLVSLDLLVLEGNPIYALVGGVFSGVNLPKLFDLKLADCHLYEIQKGAIKDLSHLKVLNLSANYLENFPAFDDVTCSLTRLTILDLSHNRLTSVDSENLLIPKSLNELILSNNLITSVSLDIKNGSVLASSSLGDLRLSKNRISIFEVKGLELMRNLTTIDLDWNELKTMEWNSFPWKDTNLTRILVNDNPWDCSSCDNRWIMEHEAVNKWETKNIRCGSPAHLVNQSITSSKVFSGCVTSDRASGHNVAFIVVALIVTSVVVIGLFFVVIRRCGKRSSSHSQLRNSMKQAQTNNSTFSYRQMENMSSPFSIRDED